MPKNAKAPRWAELLPQVSTYVLDTGMLQKLASLRKKDAKDFIDRIQSDEARVVISSGSLCELARGGSNAKNAPETLRKGKVLELEGGTEADALLGGELLRSLGRPRCATCRTHSPSVVDALVVAIAIRYRARIVTDDKDDISQLAAHRGFESNVFTLAELIESSTSP